MSESKESARLVRMLTASERKQRVRRMRLFILAWLCFLLLAAIQAWMEFHETTSGASTAGTRELVRACISSGLALAGLFFLLRGYRRSGARAWIHLRNFFGISGLGLFVAFIASLFLKGAVAQALMRMPFFGVIHLMFWDRLRTSVAQRIWEQDRPDHAPVFD